MVFGCMCLIKLYNFEKCCCIIHYNHAGVVTDGDWNTLRSKGCTRPLSIFEIRSDMRNKYSRTSIGTLTNMLTPKGICRVLQ